MASTTFVNGITLTDDEWFNNTNDVVYKVLGDGTTPPSTAIAATKNLFKQGANIASAATTNLAAATGNYVHITGTVTITALGTVNAGVPFWLVFDGVLTLTHNATSLILPGASNIITIAGDSGLFISEGSGNWRCIFFNRTTSITKRKTADETVTTSTTLQDDDHLVFPIAANEEWTVTYHADCGAALGTTGIKVAVTTPAGSTLDFSATITGLGGSGQPFGGRTTTSGTAAVNLALAAGGDQQLFGVLWVLNGATPGNVTLQWAQGTSSGTGLTLRKGSFLRANKII